MEGADPRASRQELAQMGFEVSRQLRYNGNANFTCAVATGISAIILLLNTIVLLLILIVLGGGS